MKTNNAMKGVLRKDGKKIFMKNFMIKTTSMWFHSIVKHFCCTKIKDTRFNVGCLFVCFVVQCMYAAICLQKAFSIVGINTLWFLIEKRKEKNHFISIIVAVQANAPNWVWSFKNGRKLERNVKKQKKRRWKKMQNNQFQKSKTNKTQMDSNGFLLLLKTIIVQLSNSNYQELGYVFLFFLEIFLDISNVIET